MCGISGIIKTGDKPITEAQIRLFLTGLEHRGNDATGIAMQRKNGEVLVHKSDEQAWKYVKSQEYRDFIEEYLNDDIVQVILHARAATGNANPRINNNNHPLFAGKAAAIHNGVIHNDGELFKEFEIERKAQTDSDILRGIADKWGITKEAVRKMSKLRGSCATAILHPDYPGWMILARSGSPLTLGSTPDFYAFASEKHIIHRAMRPIVFRHKQYFQVQSLDMAFSPFPDNTAYLLGPEGLEWHDEFKSMQGTYHEPVRRVYQDYKDRQRDWDTKREVTTKSNTTSKNPYDWRESKDSTENDGCIIVACPKCGKSLSLTMEQARRPRSDFHCPKDKNGCGASLGSSKVN